jgi:hypothetical protein
MDKQELLEQLGKLDEVLLIELLNLTSQDIIDAFLDRIAEREEFIRHEIEEL